jgi:glycosyltransferase involved in cell wall biosynthesis
LRGALLFGSAFLERQLNDLFQVCVQLIEAFGLAPLEAMLQGVTTVVSDAEGFREFIKPEKTGMVFPRQDVDALVTCLDRVLTDETLKSTLREGGERIVREVFNAERMVDEIEALYKTIL